ncbi:hypothetical protein [Rhodosalinus sp.]|uniref:hypothetical protein n=1 Tax=Rhodosalinus sp. TaxID=2047741 RepID=UPI003561A008
MGTDTELLRWAAALATMLAAGLVAWRGPPRQTAWGFVLFCFAALSWIAAALIDDAPALALQNVVLLGINLLGVWRWFRMP